MAGSGFAVTNVQVMSYLAELIPGTTPAAPMKNFRANTQSLDPNFKFDSSKEYRADRMIPRNERLDSDPGGDVGGEISYGSDDDLLAALLEAPGWTVTPTQSNIAFASSSTITVASTTGFTARMLVQTDNAVSAANQGIFNVASVTPTTLVMTQTSLQTETSSAAKSVKVIGNEFATGDLFATYGTPASLPSFTAALGGASAIPVSVGVGYQPFDTITLAGGTSTAPLILEVLSATGGAIDSVVIGSPGVYSALPANPVAQASTSGNGTGGTFNVGWGVSTIAGSGGSNVTAQPTISIAAPTGANPVQATAAITLDQGAATIVGAAVQVPGQGYLTVPAVTTAGGGGIGAAIGTTTQSLTTLGWLAGLWLDLGGAATLNQFATAADNGLARIIDVTQNLVKLDSTAAGFTNDSGAGKAIRVLWGDYIRNGTFMQSFTWQRLHSDVGQYFIFRGQYPGKGTIKLTTGQFIELAVTWLGLTATEQDSQAGVGAPMLVNDNPILNAVSSVVRVNIGGQQSTAYAKDLTVTIDNMLRAQKAVGTLGNVGVGSGQFTCMIEGTFYLSASLYQTYLNVEDTSISIPLVDGDGNTLIFEVPNCVITAAPVSGAQINQDVTVAMTFSGQFDALTDSQFQVTRIPFTGA